MDDDDLKPNFRGIWLSEEVLEHFWSGHINAREVMLLATIEAFSRREMGCVASNSYLAKCLQITDVTTISKMISKLRTLKLVRQISFDGRRRELCVTWRTPKTRQKS